MWGYFDIRVPPPTLRGVTKDQRSLELVPTSGLSRLSAAMNLMDHHVDLGPRYHKLITESQQQLADTEVRLSQARGIAKKLMVLAKASGDDLRSNLTASEADTLDAGLAQADELVYQH